MCPIVPTFTCGFDRSNFSFAMCVCARYEVMTATASNNLHPVSLRPFDSLRSLRAFSLPCVARHERTLRFARGEAQGESNGADDQDRTGDLVLTKDALCQLSYIGLRLRLPALPARFGETGSVRAPLTSQSASIDSSRSERERARQSLPSHSSRACVISREQRLSAVAASRLRRDIPP
jgi:hypothetical protein